MILSSGYWKEELTRQIAEFETWAPRYAYCFKDVSWERLRDTDWCTESWFRMERTLFYSAMSIRRLIDSNKVTDKLARQPLALEAFKAKVKKPHTPLTRLGHVPVDHWFDTDNPMQIHLTPYQLSSEILHSFTLEFLIDETHADIDSILVASDWNQFKRAIAIPRATWVGLLQAFVADEVMKVSVTAKENGNPEVEIS